MRSPFTTRWVGWLAVPLCAACVPTGEPFAPTGGPGEPRLVPGAAHLTSPEAAEPDLDPSPYDPGGGGGDEPAADPAAWAGAIQPVLDGLRELDAGPLFSVYSRVMTAASADCPARTRDDAEEERWVARCETEAGARFDGNAIFRRYVDLREGAVSWDGTYLYLEADVVTPTGDALHGGGSARLQVGEGREGADAYVSYYSLIQGSFVWTGELASDTWIAGEDAADAFTPDLLLIGRRYPERGTRHLTVSGTVPVAGDVVTGLVFEDLRVPAEGGEDCAVEPTGALGVRDAAGTWWETAWDGDTDPGDPACDGCGAVLHDGVSVATLCLDWTPLADWRTSPW